MKRRCSSMEDNKNNHGIALVLSVLILTNLFVITIIVTDVVLRIGKTSQQIGESEVAYFSAESAIEDAIYQIETYSNAANLGTPSSMGTGDLASTDGNWERYIQAVYTTRVICVDNDQKMGYYQVNDFAELVDALGGTMSDNSCIYSSNFNLEPLTNSNWFEIMLQPGRSFEIDFSIAAPAGENFYPNYFTIEWSSLSPPYGSGSLTPSGRIIVLSDSGGQSSYDTSISSLVRVPPSGSLGDAPDYRLRIINNYSEHVIYSIKPAAGSNLPIGILITARGYYKSDREKERIVVVERRNWEIY